MRERSQLLQMSHLHKVVLCVNKGQHSRDKTSATLNKSTCCACSSKKIPRLWSKLAVVFIHNPQEHIHSKQAEDRGVQIDKADWEREDAPLYRTRQILLANEIWIPWSGISQQCYALMRIIQRPIACWRALFIATRRLPIEIRAIQRRSHHIYAHCGVTEACSPYDMPCHQHSILVR